MVRVLRKIFRKQFCFIRHTIQYLWAVEKRSYSRFSFVVNTISSLPKVSEEGFGKWLTLCFISICKFDSFKNSFVMIISLSEFYFRFRRFILLVQTKKVIAMNYGSSTSSWKPWRIARLDLILIMKNIYINSNLIPLQKFTSSSRCTEFKDILPWNVSHKLCNETGHPISSLMESQRKPRQQYDQNFILERIPLQNKY